MIRIQHHHLEPQSIPFKPVSRKRYMQRLTEYQLAGILESDCSLVPRVLPLSYKKTIDQTAYDICLLLFRLLSLPEKEIRSILPSGPVSDFLLNELRVVKHRPDRLIGSLRFDFAVVDPPTPDNPPELLEINEIGFDGLARGSLLQESILELLKSRDSKLAKRLLSLDITKAEIRNFKRAGKKIGRVQYDTFNWDEEAQVREARRQGLDFRLIAPAELVDALDVHKDAAEPDLLKLHHLKLNRAGRLVFESSSPNHADKIQSPTLFMPNAVQVSYALALSDYIEAQSLFRKIVRSNTTQYGPFLMGLIAPKMILAVLSDASLRMRLMGSSQILKDTVLPAISLAQYRDRYGTDPKHDAANWVLKHVDGFGGEQVFMDGALRRKLKEIPRSRSHEWVLQTRTKLNTMLLSGIHSGFRRVITDLGVFVQYDWSRGRFQHFEVGGYISRGTHKSFKVNVSGGGLQIPVFFDRAS